MVKKENIKTKDSDLLLIKVTILQCYEALVESLESLKACIRADKLLPAWTENATEEKAREAAIEEITALFAKPGQVYNQTTQCQGVIGASPETLACVADVNTKKAAFKKAMSALSKQQRMVPDPDNPEQTISVPLARLVLRELHLGGLLQRQVTRQIFALPSTPLRIGFSKTASTPSITRITHEQARYRLEKLGDDYAIAQQVEDLEKLAADEILVVVIPAVEHVRQNLVYHALTGALCRQQKKTALPIFYPANPGDSLPPISMGKNKRAETKRKDYTIEQTPYLPAIHAHRYRKPCRVEKVKEAREAIEKRLAASI